MTTWRRRGCAAVALCLMGLPGHAGAQEFLLAEARPPSGGLGELSIEELSQVRVTTVSKRPELVARAPASAFVITSEAVARSTAATLPELLRLAPNLQVGRIDALDYSVSARGFGGFEAANKLLVLMDGRSVYTPIYSGVEWDQHQVFLDDLQTVEVVSGPAGSLWGANAVNGVINVTTKSAFHTRGLLAAGSVGSLDSDLRFRAGGQLGDSGAGRVYGSLFERGDLKTAAGADAGDGWGGWLVGGRYDLARGRDALTLQAEIQDSEIDASLGVQEGYVRAAHLLGRWSRQSAEGAAFEIQAYYDQSEREARLIHVELRIWDVEAQYSLTRGPHALVAGAGYRIVRDEFRTLVDPQLLTPPRRETQIANAFIQDTVALTPAVDLTLGVKLEHNTYTSTELMPSARIGWAVTDRQFLWAAASRAVRNPSRIERDFAIPGVVVPGRMGPESLFALEAGYRGRPTDRLSVSATLFRHAYDDLRSNELSAGGGLPIFVGNAVQGTTWGVEAWADLQITAWWTASLGGAYLRKDYEAQAGSRDISGLESVGADPDGWLKLQSRTRLTETVDLDVAVRAIARLEPPAASGYVRTPGYVEANMRLAWKVRPGLEAFVAGENLLRSQHPEAAEARRNEVPRSVRIGLRWNR